MDLLKKIFTPFTDALVFGNFFIACCAAGLLAETYLLLGQPVVYDGLFFFVFFSTLALYNFHRLIGVRRIKQEDRGLITGWAAEHQFTLLLLNIIGIGGALFFFFQLYSKVSIFFTLIPLAAISIFYELPLVKFKKQFERLRNLRLIKSFLITGVWGVTTALLPAMNIGIALTDYHVWLILLERLVFIFILALCFDARDVEFDKKENLQTIPIVYGIKKTQQFYVVFTTVFVALVLLHYLVLSQDWLNAAALLISGGITYAVIRRTFPRRSDYYYMFVVDGMMLLQFALLWLGSMG